MNRYYCIKCRRKLEINSYSQWNPDLPAETIKHLYASFSAWICKHCNTAYVFHNFSGNKNTVITAINLEEYLETKPTKPEGEDTI